MHADRLPIAPDSTVSPDRVRDRTELDQGGLSVADLCRRWKAGAQKIHGFIRRGELNAINIASNLSSRPQWRITRESVKAFERRRSSAPPQKPARRRRRQDVIDFYPD